MEATAEYRQIASALRKVLKNRRVTYDDLAARLGISSRTVKRIIHGEDYSVSKLAEVCAAVGIKFFDLMQLAQEEEEESFQLTVEQEEFLASSPKHFLFFYLLLRGKSLKDISAERQVSMRVVRGYAKDLDEAHLVERFPSDEIKLTVKAAAHTFITDGPLYRAIGYLDLQHFAEMLFSRQEGVKSSSTSSGTRISQKTIEQFIKEGEELAARFRLIAQRERSLLPESELIQVRWLVGIAYPFRSWIEDLQL